jgi:radical SAM protein with 4Fe4S-binding SPASM domain
MECQHLPEIPYGEFSKLLHQKGESQRLLLSASIELTERCNLRCRHCWINLPAGDRGARQRELKLDQWKRILDELAAMGCLWLLLTGGEILIHRDFQEIYRYAKKLGMIISLFTNGTLISPELADFLQEWPPFLVEITVYGRTQATYEAVTGVPGSYEKCLTGIELLRARKINLDLKTVVMTLNAHELWDLQTWARDLGARFRFDAVLSPRLDGGKAPNEFQLSPEQVVELDVRDRRRRQGWQEFVGQLEGPANSDRLYFCGAGISSLHIDPYANLSICIMSRRETFNLFQAPLQEAFQKFIPALREQKPREDYPCNHCEVRAFCDQCTAWSQLEYGAPDTVVGHLCRIAHLRAQAIYTEIDSDKNKSREG